ALAREESQLEFGIDVFSDHLRRIVGLENDRSLVSEHRHLIVSLLGQTPDQRPVVRWNVGDLEALAAEFQNPLLHQAKWAPGNLDQLDHSPSLPRMFEVLRCISTLTGATLLSRAMADKPRVIALRYFAADWSRPVRV